MKNKKEYIIQKFSEKEIPLTESQAEQFEAYYELLVETNKVMNLTAITEFEDVIEKHFLDSAVISVFYDLASVKRLMDVGTGAGFPGIPLKILYPQISVTLLDSLHKRIGFLQQAVDNLGLTDVELIHGRAEDVGRDPRHREGYDLCVSRAVANLSTLSEYCTPFVKIGGSFVSYKSGSPEEELEQAKPAIRKLGCRTKRVEKFSLGDAGRSLIFIERLEHLGKQYPRKAGLPSRSPL